MLWRSSYRLTSWKSIGSWKNASISSSSTLKKFQKFKLTWDVLTVKLSEKWQGRSHLTDSTSSRSARTNSSVDCLWKSWSSCWRRKGTTCINARTATSCSLWTRGWCFIAARLNRILIITDKYVPSISWIDPGIWRNSLHLLGKRIEYHGERSTGRCGVTYTYSNAADATSTITSAKWAIVRCIKCNQKSRWAFPDHWVQITSILVVRKKWMWPIF